MFFLYIFIINLPVGCRYTWQIVSTNGPLPLRKTKLFGDDTTLLKNTGREKISFNRKMVLI
jgi:hypothetical protein